jgi:hypothetical protein
MTTKILAFYDFIGMVAASRVRARGYSRGAPEATYSRPPHTRHIPHLRTPFECRWQIDLMTGVITACWIDSSAKGRVQ